MHRGGTEQVEVTRRAIRRYAAEILIPGSRRLFQSLADGFLKIVDRISQNTNVWDARNLGPVLPRFISATLVQDSTMIDHDALICKAKTIKAWDGGNS